MTLRDVLQVVRARRRLVLSGVLAGLTAAVLLNLVTTPLYESSARFFVSATDASASSDAAAAYQGDLLGKTRIASYAELVMDEAMAARVIAEMGLPLTAEELAGKVTASVVKDTVLLDVTVTDTSAARARDIADVLSRRFAAEVAQLEMPSGASGPAMQVTIIRPAELNPEPVRPVVARNLAIGAVLGLILGLCIALVRNRTDTSIRTAEQVQDVVGVAPIGIVPEDMLLGEGVVVTARGQHSPATVAIRAVGTRLELLDVDRPLRVVVVTSAVPEEGKTTLAVNLAVALGEAGNRVMLLEADLHRPRLASYLGTTTGAGLPDVLAGKVEAHDVSERWGNGEVTVLHAGVAASDSNERIRPARMREVVRTVQETHDIVVVDGPPLLTDPDAAVLAALADGCLLVARFGISHEEELAEAVATLSRIDATLLGVVLNAVPRYSVVGDRRPAREDDAPAGSSDAPPAPGSFVARARRRIEQRSARAVVPAVESQDRGVST